MRDADSTRPALTPDPPDGGDWVQIQVGARKLWVWGWEALPATAEKRPVEPAVDPVREPVSEPVLEPAPEPAAEPVAEPAPEPATEPALSVGQGG